LKVYLISMGCAKNSVDSEKLLGVLRAQGIEVTADIDTADMAIVNTCGFIKPAVEENIDVILELERMKELGRLEKIGVVGCLVNRYGDELKRELPSVDLWANSEEWESVASFFGFPRQTEERHRLPGTPAWSRYLKVGEGCNSSCSYCTIPSIRGGLRSVPLRELLEEAQLLVCEGAREICLVGQDLTVYGTDLYGAPGLKELLKALETDLPRDVWVRLLYLHPSRIDEPLIEMIAGSPRILSYLDIPIQHIDEDILQRMNRADSGMGIRRVFSCARSIDPLFALRTTVITGFPGETERQFSKLLDFLEETELDRVGAFTFSPEEGTPAYGMEGQIEEAVKRGRCNRLLELQAEISIERQRLFIGRRLNVLIEEVSREDDIAWGRSYREAPEVDGLIGVHGGSALEEGSIVEVLISDAEEQDLFAEIPGA